MDTPGVDAEQDVHAVTGAFGRKELAGRLGLNVGTVASGQAEVRLRRPLDAIASGDLISLYSSRRS